MQEHKPCYGKLFPSITCPRPGKEHPGAVFGYLIKQWGTVAHAPEVSVDVEAWDRCFECQEFSSCRQLSAAKILLEIAVRN